MPTLLIDNYDSYTFNLYQLLARVAGEQPVVVRNDEIDPCVLAGEPWDRIVISPGPGPPRARARPRHLPGRADAGRGAGARRLPRPPGPRARAWRRVVAAEEIVHGRISPVFHRGEGLFAGMPQGFRAVRYHSLVVEPALPPELEAIAWSDDGTLMAIGDRERRAWGVQFHPESVGTEHGERLISNFVAMTPARRPRSRPELRTTAVPGGRAPLRPTGAVHVTHRMLDGAADAEALFAARFGERESAFWLDSSLVDPKLSRFSYHGRGVRVARRGGPLPRARPPPDGHPRRHDEQHE